MLSVLILKNFSGEKGSLSDDLADIYIPFLEGFLRFNGIKCQTIDPKGLERRFSITGKYGDGIIYVPAFSEKEPADKLSFIYTESAVGTSFKVASAIRKERSELDQENVVFINCLAEGDPLKSFSPLIYDNIRVSSDSFNEELLQRIYNYSESTAKSICRYYKILFKEPQKCD